MRCLAGVVLVVEAVDGTAGEMDELPGSIEISALRVFVALAALREGCSEIAAADRVERLAGVDVRGGNA